MPFCGSLVTLLFEMLFKVRWNATAMVKIRFHHACQCPMLGGRRSQRHGHPGDWLQGGDGSWPQPWISFTTSQFDCFDPARSWQRSFVLGPESQPVCTMPCNQRLVDTAKGTRWTLVGQWLHEQLHKMNPQPSFPCCGTYLELVPFRRDKACHLHR